MSTNTVITVPDWARDYVRQYAERGRGAMLGNGTETQHATSSTEVSGNLANGANAYDSNATTFALLNDEVAGVLAIATFDTWSAPVKTYTALSVNVELAFGYIFVGGSSNSQVMWMHYSIDGGSNWTLGGSISSAQFETMPTGFVDGGVTYKARTSYSVDLPEDTDLSLLQVKITVGGLPYLSMYCRIYEVSTYGTYTVTDGSTSGFAAYSGDIIAPQSTNETDGITGLANRGRYGDQVITKAIAYADDVINGGYLLGTKAAFVAALASVTGNSTTSFASVNSRVGRKPYYVGDSDSTYLAQTFISGTSALYNARMSAYLYADNYNRERVIQDHALSYGVEMGKHAAIDAETLRQAGLAMRDYLQTTYVLTHKLFLEQQEVNVAMLEIFGNVLRALTGSQQSTTSTDPKSNKMAAAVGMGIVGAYAGWYIGAEIGTYMGSSVGGPYGAVIGFAVGAIVGYLSS